MCDETPYGTQYEAVLSGSDEIGPIRRFLVRLLGGFTPGDVTGILAEVAADAANAGAADVMQEVGQAIREAEDTASRCKHKLTAAQHRNQRLAARLDELNDEHWKFTHTGSYFRGCPIILNAESVPENRRELLREQWRAFAEHAAEFKPHL
jgi:hypothetical protein